MPETNTIGEQVLEAVVAGPDGANRLFTVTGAANVQILARLSEEAKSRYVHAYSFALIYLALGDKERAIDEMERAYRERAAGDVFFIKVDPLLDDLRGNPRFEALVQKVFAPRK